MARAKMEGGFAEVLKSLTPSQKLFELAKVMFRDAWDMRLTHAHAQQGEWKAQLKAAEKQIEDLLDRVVEAGSQSVIRAYEKRIDKLEREKIVLAEKAAKTLPPKGRLEECIELALKFLSGPWNIYNNGDHDTKRTVFKLAFAEPVRYCQNGVYGTINSAFPFKVLEGFASRNGEMVL